MKRPKRKAAMQEALGHETQPVPPLTPLVVSGLVVSRTDLVAALRVYVPGLTDIRPLDGTEDFLLVLPVAPVGDQPVPEQTD